MATLGCFWVQVAMVRWLQTKRLGGALLLQWVRAAVVCKYHCWKFELFCAFLGTHRKITIILSVPKYSNRKMQKLAE
jgi:hypothetical protein